MPKPIGIFTNKLNADLGYGEHYVIYPNTSVAVMAYVDENGKISDPHLEDTPPGSGVHDPQNFHYKPIMALGFDSGFEPTKVKSTPLWFNWNTGNFFISMDTGDEEQVVSTSFLKQQLKNLGLVKVTLTAVTKFWSSTLDEKRNIVVKWNHILYQAWKATQLPSLSDESISDMLESLKAEQQVITKKSLYSWIVSAGKFVRNEEKKPCTANAAIDF